MQVNTNLQYDLLLDMIMFLMEFCLIWERNEISSWERKEIFRHCFIHIFSCKYVSAWFSDNWSLRLFLQVNACESYNIRSLFPEEAENASINLSLLWVSLHFKILYFFFLVEDLCVFLLMWRYWGFSCKSINVQTGGLETGMGRSREGEKQNTEEKR